MSLSGLSYFSGGSYYEQWYMDGRERHRAISLGSGNCQWNEEDPPTAARTAVQAGGCIGLPDRRVPMAQICTHRLTLPSSTRSFFFTTWDVTILALRPLRGCLLILPFCSRFFYFCVMNLAVSTSIGLGICACFARRSILRRLGLSIHKLTDLLDLG